MTEINKALDLVLGVIEQLRIGSSLLSDRLDLAHEMNKQLRERVADLEHTIEELPNLGKILGAVQELQELHDAPAAKFTHYISGGRGQ